MWLWEGTLRRVGFRRLSAHYWQCERRYGLPPHAYLSVFVHCAERLAPADACGGKRVDVSAFHVTFCLGVDRVHFYFHEVADGLWEPGGHTSNAEIGTYRCDPGELRSTADRVAARLLAALGVRLSARAE